MTDPELGYQSALMNIERVIDIIYTIEILFCFVKRTMAHKDIKSISINYLSFYFWFDAIGTIPNLFFLNEGIEYYWLKIFRFIHISRLNTPPKLLMGVLLSKYSKKRQKHQLKKYKDAVMVYVNQKQKKQVKHPKRMKRRKHQ